MLMTGIFAKDVGLTSGKTGDVPRPPGRPGHRLGVQLLRLLHPLQGHRPDHPAAGDRGAGDRGARPEPARRVRDRRRAAPGPLDQRQRRAFAPGQGAGAELRPKSGREAPSAPNFDPDRTTAAGDLDGEAPAVRFPPLAPRIRSSRPAARIPIACRRFAIRVVQSAREGPVRIGLRRAFRRIFPRVVRLPGRPPACGGAPCRGTILGGWEGFAAASHFGGVRFMDRLRSFLAAAALMIAAVGIATPVRSQSAPADEPPILIQGVRSPSGSPAWTTRPGPAEVGPPGLAASVAGSAGHPDPRVGRGDQRVESRTGTPTSAGSRRTGSPRCPACAGPAGVSTEIISRARPLRLRSGWSTSRAIPSRGRSWARRSSGTATASDGSGPSEPSESCTSDARGEATLTLAEGMVVYAIRQDGEGAIVGLHRVEPEEVARPITIAMHPACRVRMRIELPDLRAAAARLNAELGDDYAWRAATVHLAGDFENPGLGMRLSHAFERRRPGIPPAARPLCARGPTARGATGSSSRWRSGRVSACGTWGPSRCPPAGAARQGIFLELSSVQPAGRPGPAG